MATQQQITKMRDRLRITNVTRDDEIADCIDTAMLEMNRCGVDTTTDNLLLFSGCELYTKYRFNFESAADRYYAAFERLTQALSMSNDYNGGAK